MSLLLGGDTYEVRNGCDAFRVDENVGTCSCRMWQLSGVPCCHAIAVMFMINKRPEDYLPSCFKVKTNHEIYHQYMNPVGGMTFWPDSSQYTKVLPPKPKKMPGRPRKQRIRAAHERKNSGKVSKAGGVMTCSNCQQKGHNRVTGTNDTVLIPPKPPVRRGRPRKNNNVEAETGGVGTSRTNLNQHVPPRAATQGTRIEVPLGNPTSAGTSSVGVKRSLFQTGSSVGLVAKRSKKVTGGSMGVKGRKPIASTSAVGQRIKKGVWSKISSSKGQPESASDPIQDSQQHGPQELQPATQQSQVNQQADNQVRQVQVNQQAGIVNQQAGNVNQQAGRVRRNFVRPRQPSQRILQKKLAKSVQGAGSSHANSLNVD